MSDLVFRDVHIALTTSYRLGVTPALDAASTRCAMIALAERLPALSRMQADWVRSLVGTRSSAVDFSGLTLFEARAQCALVRETVASLGAPDANAIIARYSQDPDEKRAGVAGLVAYLRIVERDCPVEALAALVWRHFLPQRYGDGLSLREIASRFDSARSSLARVAQQIDAELDAVEMSALLTLEEDLVQRGLCSNSFSWVPA